MEYKLLAAVHYGQSDSRDILTRAFIENFIKLDQKPIFICIGSDRHLLDCLGPLTGTMLEEHGNDMRVFGTLEDPWHAGNLQNKLREIRAEYANRQWVAVDASIGDNEQTGLIKFRTGSIKPGKAVQKNLPRVGDFAITGLVGNREDRNKYTSEKVSLAHVYNMSRVISDAIINWTCYI